MRLQLARRIVLGAHDVAYCAKPPHERWRRGFWRGASAAEAPTVPELTECEGPGELGVGESMWVEMLLGRLSSSDAEPTIWLHVRSEEEDAMRAWGAAAARHRSCRGAGERRRMERLLGWGYSGNSLRDCL